MKLKYDRELIKKQAAEHGYLRNNFEKMLRLTDFLSFIEQAPILSKDLALKGGTAINLTILRLPRLSVDIDLDLAENVSLSELAVRRQAITNAIQTYMMDEGFELSDKTKHSHSLDSFVCAYMNVDGNRDIVKIEINYSQRCHILPLEKRPIVTIGVFKPAVVQIVSPIEIFAGKINALLERAAARDPFDVNNMVLANLFDEKQQDMLRKCTVFYSAISSKNAPMEFNYDSMNDITYYKIRTGLTPVICRHERFDFVVAKERVKKYLSSLLVLTDNEREYLTAFRNGNYRPELIFEGEMLDRIKKHPMVAWKMSHSVPKLKRRCGINSGLQELNENVPIGDEKHYIPNAPAFGTKEMKDIGCEYEKETGQWFYLDPDKAQEAVKFLQEREQRRGVDGIKKNTKSIDF